MNILARFISFLFHPVLFFFPMPFLVVYKQTANIFYAFKWQIFSSAFIFLGVLIIFMETIHGDFSDFDITKREERFKFYIIILLLSVLYVTSASLFKGIYFPLSVISAGIAFGVVVFAFINRYIKASIHLCVACAFVLTNTILFGSEAFFATAWIIPIIFWARVETRKHTVQEAFVGGGLGVLITLMTLVLERYIL